MKFFWEQEVSVKFFYNYRNPEWIALAEVYAEVVLLELHQLGIVHSLNPVTQDQIIL